ncbi:MAG: oxaloacetate decarboxylase [Betaproteobacteria bacterium]|nr:oxaloacetate decarboxylase [Betaproteobacteria bacterium]
MNARQDLRRALQGDRIIVAPGVWDGMSALLVQEAGHAACCVSGSAIANMRFGRPDIGLVSMSEVAETVAVIRDRVRIPLVVDGDTGFGTAINVLRTVQVFERNGADAILFEDQTTPKRCGHLAGKSLIPPTEMVGKLKAALDSRQDAGLVIIARSDAIAVEGLEAAIERAERYIETGADMLFLEGPRTIADLQKIASRFRERIPLMIAMTAGGDRNPIPVPELERIGYRLVVFGGGNGLPRAVIHAARRYLKALAAEGTTQSLQDSMLSFDELQALLETNRMFDLGDQYSGATPAPDPQE